MPSLIKQRGRYCLQFYNSHRQPKQKRVALGTGNRRLAEQLQIRLMAAFLLGEYDPWGEPYSEIATMGEAFAAFMERKRNLRRASQDNYRWIVGSFVRHAGADLPVESLTWNHIQRWLDSTNTNDQGRYSYWQRVGIFCRSASGAAPATPLYCESEYWDVAERLLDEVPFISDQRLEAMLDVATGELDKRRNRR